MSGSLYPAAQAETYNPDRLVIDTRLVVTRGGETVGAGANLARGTLMGRRTIATGAVTIAAAGAGGGGANTGNGTCVAAGSPVLANAVVGDYIARCITAGANSATFRLIDPLGRVLGDVSYSGAGASAVFSNQVGFTITDGSTDFIVGDAFRITVAAGDNKLFRSVASAIDGTQTPTGILVDQANAASADVTGAIYVAGEFDETAVLYGAGHTAASVRNGLRALGIYLRTPGALAS
jgi:hypothetical protein